MLDRLGPGDLDSAIALSTQAGWNQTEADWTRIFDLSPEGCIAARVSGRVAGTATVASFGRSLHWIGMVLVDSALRGRGIGSALMGRSLEVARDRGGGTVGLDASDLGRPVYLKQGFVDVAPIDRWSGILRCPDSPREASIADRSRLEEISRLDREACGTDRSALLGHLFDEPGVSCGIVRRGAVAAYAFLRPGREAWHLGPSSAARDEDFGSLLALLSDRAAGSAVLVDALRSPGTTRLLEASGLSISRRLTRMTLGSPRPVLAGSTVRAAVSFEWG